MNYLCNELGGVGDEQHSNSGDTAFREKQKHHNHLKETGRKIIRI